VKNTALALTILSVFTAAAASAGPTADKKQREGLDKAIAQAAADVKDCGKTFKLSFDWAAYDKLDWSKAARKKEEQVGFEISNVRWIGSGLNTLCKDKDYKETLQKIDNVVYRTILDSGEKGESRTKAKIQGTTLTFESRMGGSTRDSSDFASAAKKVL